VIVYNSRLHSRSMGNQYDPEREAEAALKLAAAADGLERQRWIRLALAWQEMARARPPLGTNRSTEEAA